MKYSLDYTNKFKKHIKKIKKQGKDLNKLYKVIESLTNGEPLDIKYHNHKLINDDNYSNCYECHIEPDWLLIYKIYEDTLILLLFDTGSHSELFM